MTDNRRQRVELVVLLASAGGLEALSIVLHDLPTEFPAAIVVQQHLGGISSVLPTILGRQTPHRVSWAQDGQAVVPGQVVVCPPGTHLELAPDGRCRLHEMATLIERRFDLLLASVAKSYGPRSVAVLLSGSGQDGAVGAVAMKRSGAIVIAQSPDTAQYAALPMAAVRAGADLVLPPHEIGHVLAELVAGGAPVSSAPRSVEGNGDHTTTTQKEAMHTGDVVVPNSAAARGDIARQRVAELARRRRELSNGFGATAQTVAVARRRAQESLRRAQLAHQQASAAAARWGH